MEIKETETKRIPEVRMMKGSGTGDPISFIEKHYESSLKLIINDSKIDSASFDKKIKKKYSNKQLKLSPNMGKEF